MTREPGKGLAFHSECEIQLQVYREEKEPWLGFPLEGLAKNMRAVALAANAEARKSGRKSGALENCGSSLQRVFATAIGGSENCYSALILL